MIDLDDVPLDSSLPHRVKGGVAVVGHLQLLTLTPITSL